MDQFSRYASYVNPRQNMKGFAVLIMMIVVLGISGAALVTNPDEEAASVDEATIQEEFSSPNTFVYAYWAGEKSEIKSMDLSTGEERLLATLPFDVKYVKLLSPTEIIYIADTADDSDYGGSIVIKQIPDGEERVVVVASEDVRIDDYRVSPSGRYIATWEVARPVGDTRLFGGISRVYGMDVSTGEKHLLYSEQATVPVHYPVAVTDSGDVYTDTFLPNDIYGFAYGMSKSNITGTVQEDLAQVASGTYGSQPVVSPDGSQLAFVGYDGTEGLGTDIVASGGVPVRRAILSPNTVDVLDLATGTRRQLPGLASENSYSSVWWDEVSGELFLNLLSRNVQAMGTYAYDVATGQHAKLSTSIVPGATTEVISSLSDNAYLAGRQAQSDTTGANLGGYYTQLLEGAYVVDQNAQQVIPLDITGGFVQSIAVKPTSYFGGMMSFAEDGGADAGGLKSTEREQLQLQAFTLKPQLEPKRIQQQSSDKCRAVVGARCNETLGTNYEPLEALQAKKGKHDDIAFVTCVQSQWSDARNAGICSDSPLYLYGERGAGVSVRVGTVVTRTVAPYSPEHGFVGTLTGDGGVMIEGARYSSLEFDYETARSVVPPSRGVIIRRETLNDQLSEYASRLGMNENEKRDFISYISGAVSAGQFFISHFSHEVSEKLLPLEISPLPDSYTNMVFYIDENRTVTSGEPEYKTIVRDGFTAVEISYILQG